MKTFFPKKKFVLITNIYFQVPNLGTLASLFNDRMSIKFSSQNILPMYYKDISCLMKRTKIDHSRPSVFNNGI